MKVIDSSWIPAVAIHPLELLKDELKARGIKRNEFAKLIGMQASNFSRMLTNNQDITTAFALKLEEALGIPARHWTGLQEQYHRDTKAIKQAEEQDILASHEWQKWDKLVNMLELCKRLGLKSYLGIKEQLRQLAQYIDLEREVENLNMVGAFKRSELLAVDERNLNTWVLLSRAKAKSVEVGIFQSDLIDECARQLSQMAHQCTATLPNVTELLARYGIALVYVPSLNKTPVDGYSTWIEENPCIAVTLRYKDMDRFAFDVLHELGHIKLHLSDATSSIGYVSLNDYSSNNREEVEANKYAEQHLISDADWKKLCNQSAKTLNPHIIAREIANKALELGISPSIAQWRYKKEAQVYNIVGHTSPKLQVI